MSNLRDRKLSDSDPIRIAKRTPGSDPTNERTNERTHRIRTAVYQEQVVDAHARCKKFTSAVQENATPLARRATT